MIPISIVNRSDMQQYHVVWYLTHCGLVPPYGNTELGQHWLGWCLFAWWPQAITQTNVDLTSKVFCGIHLAAILQVLINSMCLKITISKLLPHLPGANEIYFAMLYYRYTSPLKKHFHMLWHFSSHHFHGDTTITLGWLSHRPAATNYCAFPDW